MENLDIEMPEDDHEEGLARPRGRIAEWWHGLSRTKKCIIATSLLEIVLIIGFGGLIVAVDYIYGLRKNTQ